MNWWEKLKWFCCKLPSIGATLISHREDINSNTSENAKLLYRLEELELQVMVLKEKVQKL